MSAERDALLDGAPTVGAAGGATPSRTKRWLSLLLAVSALLFIAWVVPIRDRCAYSDGARSVLVSVSRDQVGCVVHLRQGERRVSLSECNALQCEPGVATTVTNARLGMLVGLLAAFFLGTVVLAMRWRMLLALADVHLSLFETWRISLQSLAGGVLLPGGVGGDALRVAMTVGKGASTPIAVATVLLDRVIGLATLGGLAAGLAVIDRGESAGLATWILGILPFLFVLGIAVLRSSWLGEWHGSGESWLGRRLSPILAYVRDARAVRAIGFAFVMSILVSAMNLALIRGIVFSLHGEPNGEKWIYVGTASAMIVSSVPALPGGWGTAEAAYVFFLGLAGLSSATALSVSLTYRLFGYATAVVGAFLYFAKRSNTSRKEPP